MATSKPGVTRYMAPELLDPPQFGFKHSNPSKASDVYSFAMTAYEVFSSYLVTRIANKRLLPMSRSSQETCHMACGLRASPPLLLCPATGHPAQGIQRPTSGFLIRYGTSSGAAGTRIHGPGCPHSHYIKDSPNCSRNKKGVPQSLTVVGVSRDSLVALLLKPTSRHRGDGYQVP